MILLDGPPAAVYISEHWPCVRGWCETEQMIPPNIRKFSWFFF